MTQVISELILHYLYIIAGQIGIALVIFYFTTARKKTRWVYEAELKGNNWFSKNRWRLARLCCGWFLVFLLMGLHVFGYLAIFENS